MLSGLPFQLRLFFLTQLLLLHDIPHPLDLCLCENPKLPIVPQLFFLLLSLSGLFLAPFQLVLQEGGFLAVAPTVAQMGATHVSVVFYREFEWAFHWDYCAFYKINSLGSDLNVFLIIFLKKDYNLWMFNVTNL